MNTAVYYVMLAFPLNKKKPTLPIRGHKARLPMRETGDIFKQYCKYMSSDKSLLYVSVRSCVKASQPDISLSAPENLLIFRRNRRQTKGWKTQSCSDWI